MTRSQSRRASPCAAPELGVEDAAEAAAIYGAVRGRTMVDVLADAVRDAADLPALSWTRAGGTDVTLSWAEVGEVVADLAAGLLSLGLVPGETVALMAPNCGEHVLADQAVVHAGGLPFTVYATSSPEQVADLAAQAGAAIAVLHGAAEVRRWEQALVPRLRHAIVVDPAACPGEDSRFLTYEALLARGRAFRAADPARLMKRQATVRPTDPVALIYTSGTTGRPKGVLLTHENVLYKAEAWRRSTGVATHPVSISYLPYAHVSERVNGLYVPFHLAGHVHFCANLDDFPELLADVRPHSLTAVPRIWEKLLARLEVHLQVAEAPDRLRTRRAAEIARRYLVETERGQPSEQVLTAYWTAERETLTPLRRVVGLDRTCALASTAAPASGPVADFFAGLGLRVSSVYGMTETTGGITANRPSAFRSGTVGRLVAGCAARLAADGELLVRGPIVTPGYRDDPEATAEFLGTDGWAHTGDLATIEGGYLRIVGRKKDLLVTAGGENVAPTLIEGLLQAQPGVAQAMAYGDGRRYLTALIVPDSAVPDAESLVARAVEATNAKLARVQQIKAWRLVESPWTVESGALTPTLKLKRHVVAEQHADLIDAMYTQVPAVAG